MIYLNPQNHTYYDDQKNIYTSVTTLLNQIFPFDQTQIIEQVIQNPRSKYYKWPKQKILNHWKERAEEGTKLHKACEDYINSKIIPENEYAPLIKQFSKLAFKGQLISEHIVGDKDYLLAGTIDILEQLNDVYWIWDIKTNANIDDDKLMKYSIQLDLYRRFAAKTYGKKVLIGGIIYFENLFFKKEKAKLKVFRVHNVQPTVDHILKERQQNLKKLNLI